MNADRGHDVGPSILFAVFALIGAVILGLLVLSVDLRHQTDPGPAPFVQLVTPSPHPGPPVNGGGR
jgi:hypothetical protein